MALKDLSVKELKSIKDRDEKRSQEQNEKRIRDNLEILISACRVAQEKGAFTLEESRHIMNAIDILQTKNTSYHY